MTDLLDALQKARSLKRKLFVPYLVAGVPDELGFAAALHAVAPHADVVEVGIPYSDPLMDGPVIASAAERALRAGVSPRGALELGARAGAPVRRVVMTYYNPIHRVGEGDFCRRARRLGYEGLIVPDVPLEESTGLRAAAAESGLAWIPLVAPTTRPDRARAIARTATGFVYAVSTLGVTGERAQLSDRAAAVVAMCREATDLPVLIGIGVSTPEQAREAASIADGAVVGSALVKRLLEQGPAAAGELARAIRDALSD